MCSLFIDLNHHHYILNIDLKKLASQQKSIQMKMRLLALAYFKDGYS
ncbi:transposase, partial [Vibrio parahaemolyticus]